MESVVWISNLYGTKTNINKYERNTRLSFARWFGHLKDPDGYPVDKPQKYEDRQMWIGETPRGRVLSIIFTTEEDSQILRLITAFDVAERFVVEYYNTRRGI
jgi:uncharacterized DUF497 family protein